MLALVRNIEKSQGYTGLNEYMNEKYKDLSNGNEAKEKIKFYTYEDNRGQDLQSSSGDQKSGISCLSFEKFLDKIYTEVGN